MVWLHDRKQDLGLRCVDETCVEVLGCAIDGASGEGRSDQMHGQNKYMKLLLVLCAMMLKNVW